MSGPPAFHAASFFPPGADRYRVIRALGSGAYGVVAECVDTVTNRHVAVKKIPRFLSDVTDVRAGGARDAVRGVRAR